MNVTFTDTRIYLGFLESTEIDRLSDKDRKKFEENWRALLMNAGASQVEIRPFGIQGLKSWAVRMFKEGPSGGAQVV